MKTAFPLQFLVDLTQLSRRLNLPTFLKEILRQGDIANQNRLEEFFTQELPNVPLQSQETVDYFLFLSNQAMQMYFYRNDYEGFNHTIEILKHRMVSLRNVQNSEVNIAGWEQYLDLAQVAFQRLLRHVSIEAYEKHIDGLDWTMFDKAFIASISRIIGFVYLNEDADDQASKSRLWLQKAIYESDFSQNLSNYLYTASYYLDRPSSDSHKRIEGIIDTLSKGIAEKLDKDLVNFFSAAQFELKAKSLQFEFANFDDNLTKLEYSQQKTRELELTYSKEESLPICSKSHIEATIAQLYTMLFDITNDDLEEAGFSKYALRFIDKALDQAESSQNSADIMYFKLLKGEFAVKTNASLTEKDAKETIQHYKKSNSYPLYVRAANNYINLVVRNGQSAKAADLILDLFKQGTKRMEQGGFYLINSGLRLANDVFLIETGNPGVSWIVKEVEDFFRRLIDITEEIDNHLELIGKSLIETFRTEYKRFEPVSHFNAKVYLLYQLYELKMMRIGAVIHGDELSIQIADNLIKEMEDENNPLSFIKANWEEFKNVPNDVRNKMLNKCISISKGDLPLAAEHLEFSYRNLRSYITFKEVNRLGFFLDLQQTDNKQLEQGIRYMFYDLYKNGTIFEVVFDMPKFLVRYAKKGFYSQDLEQELNIKGTTAKKYIKIMMEIGLIRQDKTTGRKHYYRLIRENVMKRLGKDLTTLISPQSEF